MILPEPEQEGHWMPISGSGAPTKDSLTTVLKALLEEELEVVRSAVRTDG